MRASTLGGGGRQGRCAHGSSNRGPFDVPDLVELCGARSNNAGREDYGYSPAVNPNGPSRSSVREGGVNARNCTPAMGGTLPNYAMRGQMHQQQIAHDHHLYQQHLHQHHNHAAAAMQPQNNDRRFNPASAAMSDGAAGAGQDHAGRNYRGVQPNNPLSQQQAMMAANSRHQENHYCAMPQMNNGGGGCCCPPGAGNAGGGTGGPLPDILNSHRIDVPPPYEPAAPSRLHAVQFNAAATGNNGAPSQNHGWANNASPQLVTTSTLSRAQVPLVARLSGGVNYKHCFNQQCCLRCVIAMTTFRWMLASFAVLGIGCIVAGLVLGALQMASGSGYLLHSLLFMGLGVLLVVVIGIGWRCTPEGQEPCHLFLNLTEGSMYSATAGGTDGRLIYRRRGRGQSTYSQWHGGVCYPEFQNRCPPPSYSAAVQDSQRQQMMARLHLVPAADGEPGVDHRQAEYSPASPPPTYRSQSSIIGRPSLASVAAAPSAVARIPSVDLPVPPNVQSAPAALQPPPRYPSSSSPPPAQQHQQQASSMGTMSPPQAQRCNYQTLPLIHSHHQVNRSQGLAWLIEPLQSENIASTPASSGGGAQNLYQSHRLCGCRPAPPAQLQVSETNFVTSSSGVCSGGENRSLYGTSASNQCPRSTYDKTEHPVEQKKSSVGSEQVYNDCQFERHDSAPVSKNGKSAVVQSFPAPTSFIPCKPIRNESTKLSQRPPQTNNGGTSAPSLSGCALVELLPAAAQKGSDKTVKGNKISRESESLNLGISDYYAVANRGCVSAPVDEEGQYNSSQIKSTRRSNDLWLSDFPTEPRVQKPAVGSNGASHHDHVPASCLNVVLPPQLGTGRVQQQRCSNVDHEQRRDASPFSDNAEK